MLTNGFTLSVTRPAGTDRFGKKLPSPPPHAIDGCAAAPAGSTELVNGQATVIEKDTVYAPYDADIKPQDEVTVPADQSIDAGVYQVDGQPARWKSPYSGNKSGCVIRLTNADG